MKHTEADGASEKLPSETKKRVFDIQKNKIRLQISKSQED